MFMYTYEVHVHMFSLVLLYCSWVGAKLELQIKLLIKSYCKFTYLNYSAHGPSAQFIFNKTMNE